MLSDLAFPCSVMVMKLLFKLAVEQEIKIVDALRALLVFPIDIAFLSFSFGAALLYAIPAQRIQSGNVRTMFIFLIIGLIGLILITVSAKKSEKLFVADNYKLMMFLSAVSYVLSLVGVWAALNVAGLL
jgi:hypothetical protein